MTDVLALAQELIRFDTVNPPGNEEAPMRHLGAVLEAQGISVEYQRLSEDRVNLIARVSGDGKCHLALCGHMDVVHPGETPWEHPPFEARVVDGRLIGRGSTDMKGGVAAMAVALIELANEGFRPKADLILAVTAGEEVDMAGARLMAAGNVLAGTANIVIGEPTGLGVYRAEKGVLWIRVTAHGRTAHGSMPHLGVNAISFMARLIHGLEQYSFAFVESDILGRPTLSVNTIAGGVKTNVVADRCAIEIDMRLVPGQTREDILHRLQAILDETAAVIPAPTTTEILQDVPPVETRASDPLVEAAMGAALNAGSAAAEAGGVSFGTDGAILAPALGASMVIFGPGGLDQLHQPNEYVEIEQLHQAVDAYKQIARRMLTA